MSKKPKFTYKYIGVIFFYGEGFYIKGLKDADEAALWMASHREDEGQLFEVGKEMDTTLTTVIFPKEVDNG